MKKFFLSMLTLALGTMAMNATVENLTVADGNASSAYAPINTVWYGDEGALPNSQLIYNASMLQNMVGGKIIGVKFYFDNNGSTFSGGKYDLKLGTTDKESWGFFDEAHIDDVPTVLTDLTAPELGSMELEFTFDTPIDYTGGNLVIETVCTETGSVETESYFVGENQSGQYVCWSSYYNTGAEQRYINTYTFMPKTTFIYEVPTKDYDVRVAPEALNFGKVLLGDAMTLNLTITNRGANAVTPAIALDAPFTVDYTATQLGNEESVDVAVTFTPTAVADYSTTLTITCVEGGNIEVPITAAGTDTPEVTVCDGTATEEHLPIYAYYFDAEITNSAMIYPAELFSNMQGSKITQVKFYPTAPLGDFGTAVASFAFGTTEDTDPSAEFENLTVCGTIASTPGAEELVIDLDEPYTYEGGNLVVKTQVTTTGNYVKTFFYGEAQDARLGFCQWSPYGNGTYLFLPKMTLIYEKDQAVAVDKIDTDAAVKSVKYVNPMGRVSNVPFEGVNIVVTEMTDGTTRSTKVLK